MAVNILIAEDDIDIVDVLSLHLDNSETRVLTAHNGQQALDIFNTQQVDLCLIDIMMPAMDGYTLIKRIRERSNVPIIVISAKTLDEDKILGLNIGADDYIEKPFKALEVVARVNAQLRRFNKLGANPNLGTPVTLTLGELTLDTQAMRLSKGGQNIDLTSAEYKILHLLIQSPRRVFTRAQIYQAVFGEYYSADDNTVMMHISNLRAKIEDDSKHPQYIQTVRGLGYKIEQP